MFQKLFVEPINIIILMSLLFIVSTKLALIALLIIPVSGIIILVFLIVFEEDLQKPGSISWNNFYDS